MIGYFLLGSNRNSGTPPQLPFGEPDLIGNHTLSTTRGHHAIFDIKDWSHTEIHIPSRDKKVDLWAASEVEPFSERIKTLDSQFKGQTYATKLGHIIGDLRPDFQAVLVNTNTSSHGNLAILDLTRTISFFGIYDTHYEASYLFWGNEGDVRALFQSSPLRYQLYRFPRIPVVFIASETLCAKWWRWTKNNSLLRAFNALEMRLVNGSPF